jgi:hypothetical protein
MTYPVHNPEWAVDDIVFADGTDNKKRPTPNLRQYGYTPNSFPTAQELNWQLNNIYLQIQEAKSQIVAPTQLPIGFIMMLSGVSTNPSDLLGYGAWERIGQGRTIIGAGTGVDANGESRAFTDGDLLGEYSHTLSEAEMPQHSHSGGVSGPQGGPSAKIEGYVQGAPKSDNYVPTSTGTAGSSQAHNNIQPSFVCFLWKRVS